MKTMNKKGQGAMEYLMTYGWAILVVLIVGIVLWQLGIFSGIGGGANKSTGFSVLAPVDKTIYFDASGNNVTFLMENRAGSTLNIAATAAAATGSCTDYLIFKVGGVTNDSATQAIIIPAGQTADVTIANCGSPTAGDSLSVDVIITYTERVAGKVLSHTESGTIRGVVEP